MKRTTFSLLVLAALNVLHANAAEFINYSSALGGTQNEQEWVESTLVRPSGVSTGTAGSSSEWSSGIAPVSNSGSISLLPAVGGETTDFLTGGGIYSFFSQTHYEVNSTVALTGFQSMIFQIYMGAGLSGQFGGSAVDVESAPTLTLTVNGSPVIIGAANYSLLQSSVSTFVPAIGLNTTLDSFGYQWDLSRVTGTISAYAIDWQTSYHSILYGADVTESTAIHTTNILQAATVPEPSEYALLTLGLGIVIWSQRFRFFSKTNV